MSRPGPLADLAWHFALLSLVAVGGANAVVPEMHRHAVEVAGWMSDREFAALFAIAQAAPGPNVLIATLIGWRVAGVPGGLLATVAMCGPSSLLVLAVAKAWDRFKERPWHAAVRDGLAPVTVGLVAASGFLLARAADIDLLTTGVTLATAALATATRVNPLWAFGAAAALGALLAA